MKMQEQLAVLGLWVLLEQRKFELDVCGGDIQDKAKELGLLVSVEVTEPCGEECTCAEFGEFPQQCLRMIPELRPPQPKEEA